MELISSPLSTNLHQNPNNLEENDFQASSSVQRSTHKFNKIKKIISESSNKKRKENDENNYNDLILKSEITKSDNQYCKCGNNQASFNCNCMGKYSYKNTEAITILNNNTNENNIINTYYLTTERKTFDKTSTTNNKTNNSKTKKDKNCANFYTVIDKKTKNKSNNRKDTIINTNININTHYDNNINIIDNLMDNNGEEKVCLDLEILNSWNLPIGLQLHIDQYGLKNSIRNEKDGIAYFGYQTEEDLNTNPYIDYLLGPKDQEYDEQFIGKHFQIRFDQDTKKYYIKDLGNGFGTFIKLINELKIKDNLLINIGETYMVFSFINDNEEQLIIKIFTGDEQCNTYTFNSDNQTCIIVGRDSSLCDVVIDDKMLSRMHCYLNYKENHNDKGWFIKDGDIKGKKSTNDTWFYSAEETLIYDKMIFKTNHILIKCIYK